MITEVNMERRFLNNRSMNLTMMDPEKKLRAIEEKNRELTMKLSEANARILVYEMDQVCSSRGEGDIPENLFIGTFYRPPQRF